MRKFDPTGAAKQSSPPDWASWADILKCPAEHACPEDHHLLAVLTADNRFGGIAVALKLANRADDPSDSLEGQTVQFDLTLSMLAEMVEYVGRYHLGILPGGEIIDLDKAGALMEESLPPSNGKTGSDAIH